jgi:hypothetical protein
MLPYQSPKIIPTADNIGGVLVHCRPPSVRSFNHNLVERAPGEGFAAEQFMSLFVARSNLMNSKIAVTSW